LDLGRVPYWELLLTKDRVESNAPADVHEDEMTKALGNIVLADNNGDLFEEAAPHELYNKVRTDLRPRRFGRARTPSKQCQQKHVQRLLRLEMDRCPVPKTPWQSESVDIDVESQRTMSSQTIRVLCLHIEIMQQGGIDMQCRSRSNQ
jgi:hypothetical protein